MLNLAWVSSDASCKFSRSKQNFLPLRKLNRVLNLVLLCTRVHTVLHRSTQLYNKLNLLVVLNLDLLARLRVVLPDAGVLNLVPTL